MIKEFHESKNLLPRPTSTKTETIGDMTFALDNNGVITISGTASESVTFSYNLAQTYTMPTSKSQGGDAYLYLWNSTTTNGTIRFFYDDTQRDYWSMGTVNRVLTGFDNLENQTINRIEIRIPSGTSYNGTIAPMVTNDGEQATHFEPYGDTWNTKSYVKSITGTQTYTEFPIVLRTTEQSIPTWNVKGNEEHTGTPSPQNPVEVNGVGVRTANIFDSSKESKNTYISIYGNTGTSTVTNTSDYVKINSSTLVLSGIRTTALQNASERACCFYDASKTLIDGALNPADISTPCIITVPQNTAYIRFAYDKSFEGAVMLNEGAVAIPYEPYGYKLDISNGQQTTNIYLGSTTLDKNGTAVDTIGNNTLYKATNRAVLTGSENWTLQSINQYGIANFYLANVLTGLDINEGILCSHGERQTTVISQTTTEGFLANNNGEIYFRINSTTASTVPEFQAWLSEQNPQVTFLYTLATPTNTTVTVPSIPTTSGLNTIDANTTLKPSEMSLTYDGYKLCKGQRYSRTENLFDGIVEQGTLSESSATGSTYEQTKSSSTQSNRIRTAQLVTCGGEVTISCDFTKYQLYLLYYDANGLYTGQHSSNWNSSAVTINQQNIGIAIRRLNNADLSPADIDDIKLMVNTGSTAKLYQPYLDWE